MFAILVRSSAVVLLGVTATPVLSQTVVTGVVRLERGGPLVNAGVQLQGTHGGVTTTDSGRYRLVVPNDGFATVDSLTLIARAIGFEPATRKVLARPGNYTLDFELKPATLKLEGVVVTRTAALATDEGAPAVAKDRRKAVVDRLGSRTAMSDEARPARLLRPH
jgi:carboxypeptidase-like protein